MRIKDETKKAAIFQATLQLLNEIGFSAISMSKIAKKAGVSASTIYVYFENKDDVMQKLYLDTKQKMSRAMFKQVNASGEVEVEIKKVIRNYISFLTEQTEDFLLLEQFENSPYIREIAESEIEPLFKVIYTLADRGKAENLLKKIDNEIIMAFMESPITHLAKNYFTFTPERIENLVVLSWDAIKK